MRNTDYGLLVGPETLRFIDGREGLVEVPANIRAERPIKVWVVKPTVTSGWIVAGELRNI